MGSYDSGRASDLGGINIEARRPDSLNGIRFGDSRTSHPNSANDVVLYRYGTGLYLWDGSTRTLLGAAGGGGSYTAPSLDQIFAGDQTLDLTSLSTLTIDRSSGNNNILTLTNSGAGSGHVLAISNVGTGKDIYGTGGLWSVSKVGDIIGNIITLAGDTGSNSITLTTGDVSVAAGSVTIIDKADNAVTLSVTNDTATTASAFVFAASAAFTGNTTSSLMTITSGATTGTVLYIPVAALTQGKGINLIGTTALTTGVMLNVESGTTGTTLGTTGRLLRVAHTGTGTNSGVLAEVTSAAADETTVFQVGATGVLAAGYALKLSTASVTTGTLIGVLGAALTSGSVLVCTDMVALTTGVGINLAHATSIITTGSLVRLTSSGVNTGSGGDGTMLDITASGQLAGSLVTVDTIQTTGTAMSIISTGIMTTTGNLLTLTANSATTAAGLVRINANGLTSGIGLVIASSSTGLTGAGRLLYVGHTGNAGDASGIVAEIASAAADETVVFRVTGSAALAGGVLMDLSAAAITTGTVLDLGGLAAITTGNGIVVAASGTTRTDGMLLSISDASTAATSTGRMLLVNHTGATGVSTVLSEFASAANDETILVQITASAANALGKALYVSTATTTGNGVSIVANSITDGFALTASSSNVTLSSTGRLLLINHSGNATVSGVIAEVKSAAADETIIFQVLGSAALAAGKAVNVSVSAMTTGIALSIDNADALTTGKVVSITSNSADVTARSLLYIKNDHASAVGVAPLTIVNDSVQGTGSKFKRAATFCGISIWISIDGTTPNGALTGDAVGDLCLNASTGKPLICTGTNVWAAVA